MARAGKDRENDDARLRAPEPSSLAAGARAPSGSRRLPRRASRASIAPMPARGIRTPRHGEDAMKATRRTFLQTTAAAAALTQAPSVLRAQPAAGKTIRAVMQGDLRAFDPIWTTANITAYHGSMIYDTLFALDENMKSQPQMVVEMRRLGRQAHLHLRAARRLEVLGRLGRHLGRRRRLDPALGGARRRRPAHDAARQGHRQEGRQDLHHRAEGALRPRRRPDGEDHDAAPLHHAQEGGRDRSECSR